MSTSPSAAEIQTDRREAKKRLVALTLRDEHRLRRRLDRAKSPSALAALNEEIHRGRDAHRGPTRPGPAITYPEALPVHPTPDDIAAAIASHQVVIVAGRDRLRQDHADPEDLPRTRPRNPGHDRHTQPRRLAARTVAERIAEEVGRDLGDTVGYTVRSRPGLRFHPGQTETDASCLRRDPARPNAPPLRHAHHRRGARAQPHIDFILGYLKQLLPRRPDLKVVITSATIDPERFAEHFAVDGVPAPIVEVSGRTFPVEMRYRPLTVEVGEQTFDRDPVDARVRSGPGTVGRGRRRHPRVPLRLARDPRHRRRVARPQAAGHRDRAAVRAAVRGRTAQGVSPTQRATGGAVHQRRRDVADRARHPIRRRPGHRANLALLGADQGAAPAHRTDLAGVGPPRAPAAAAASRTASLGASGCTRWRTTSRHAPSSPKPEILRTNLASVVLQMTALGLGDIEAFPFVEKPDPRAIRDGIALLEDWVRSRPASGPRR